jgi:hypothetical protein
VSVPDLSAMTDTRTRGWLPSGDKSSTFWASIAIAGVALACGPHPPPPPVAPTPPDQPSSTPPGVTPPPEGLPLDPTLGSALIQRPGRLGDARRSFRTDAAILGIPPNLDLRTALKQLEPTGLVLHNATANGAPLCTMSCASPADCSATHRPAPAKASWALVKIPEKALKLIDPETARREINAAFQGKIRPGSNRSAQALAYLMRHNKAFAAQGLWLAPDLPVHQNGILTQTAEARADPPLDAVQDKNAQTADLVRAWQLAQVAAPLPRRALRAAVVDRGFAQAPIGISWDIILSADGKVKGNDSALPFHGTRCASVLNASVNEKVGAFGAALLGSASEIEVLAPRRVRTIAASIPEPYLSNVASYIECSIEKGLADVVSVSLTSLCPENGGSSDLDCSSRAIEPLRQALSYAEAQNVPVLFAAGNQGRNLKGRGSGDEVVGCELQGALCVGALGAMEMTGRRLDSANIASNFGDNVKIWAPGQVVVVNAEDDANKKLDTIGTSSATAFAAGVVALAESAWGQTFGSEALRSDLALAILPKCSAAGDEFCASANSDVSPGILSAYRLIRRRVKIAPDKAEPNDVRDQAKELTPGVESTLSSLHTDADQDFWLLKNPGCNRLQIKLDYLVDTDLGELRVELKKANGVEVNRNVTEARPGRLELTFTKLAAGSYFLRVWQDDRLTTGYSLIPTFDDCAG